MDTGFLNEQAAKTIIKELIHQGVRKFCIAPGSRSTPLVTAAAEHPLAENVVHFDERGLGFYALGLAKAKKTPVAIIVTSGTALGNLMPAVIEAHHAHVPLIILSADRPPELLDCGANQTIDQTKFFGTFVGWECHLPCPSNTMKFDYVSSSIAYGVHKAKSAPIGPVHINCAFRKPFASETTPNLEIPSNVKRFYASLHQMPHDDEISMLADCLSPIENGVIIAGSLPYDTPPESLETLSRLLQWPIIADINSGLRSQGDIHGLAKYHDLILKSLSTHDELRLDGVLHFGGPVVSKALNEWITKHTPECYCHVTASAKRQDPHHIATHYFDAKPQHFASELTQYLPGRGPSSWMALWNNLSSTLHERIHTFFTGSSEISEPGVVRLLNDLPAQAAVFVGNSMPIRDADSFFYPKKETAPLFANRGASGIDGNIATASGICKALDRPTLAILGDQTTLHDLSSLSLAKTLNQPLVILTINNGGGGIFSFLPVAKKQNIVEEYFAASHELHFKAVAQTFGYAYHLPKTIESLSEIVLDALDSSGPCLIEVITNRQRNFDLHEELQAHLTDLNPKAKTASFPCYAEALQ